MPYRIAVVSYRNSTSNHNIFRTFPFGAGVVSYRNSTSNHNSLVVFVNNARLYLIEILHQTTTYIREAETLRRCILSKFYIKPQQNGDHFYKAKSCILSKFYIKPQPCFYSAFLFEVVSYRNSTSNHNRNDTFICRSVCCILSKFYIKPQQSLKCFITERVVSYRNSTSNHNLPPFFLFGL